MRARAYNMYMCVSSAVCLFCQTTAACIYCFYTLPAPLMPRLAYDMHVSALWLCVRVWRPSPPPRQLRTFAPRKIPSMSYEEGLVAVKFHKEGGEAWMDWTRDYWKFPRPQSSPMVSSKSLSSLPLLSPPLEQ